MKFLFCIFSSVLFFSSSAQINKGHVHILYTPGAPANEFIPAKNVGAAFDGHEKGDIDHMLTPENIKAMKSVGLSPLSYRLRTELQGEVWHWNPKGTWSESGKQQGYWVSDSLPGKPINISNGYFLPRRGNTIDQANNKGYSRLDDGDQNSFWKSNPYLDEHFTHESNAEHSQWVVVDLDGLMDVNAVKINWGNPYPSSIKVEYALDIGSDYFEPFQPGLWNPFPAGHITGIKGGNKIISVSDKPIKVRLIRITLMGSSYVTTKGSLDIRDRLGFAIKEIEVGLLKRGKFTDWVKHAADHNKQSKIYVSSTDPWHRASDIDANVEQAGIDKFFNCGLTGDQPTLMPVGLLYDTPENMEAMLKYLIAKKYPVEELEMGEEPEGQLIAPVDYASLYLQWANKLKAISPNIRFGGPGFATLAFTEDDIAGFSEGEWTSIFLDYLKKHNSIDLFNFFSFEWYPFDDVCAATAPQLAVAPQMLNTALKDIQQNVLPKNVPIYLTEYGYSAFSGKAEVEIEGALMYADILGKFITMGGDKSFLYGYEPAYLETEGCDWGNNILFGLDDNRNIEYKTAAYYGMWILTHFWLQPANSGVQVYPVKCDVENKQKQPLITAYAILKPGGKWSLMLINKDPLNKWNINVDIQDTASGSAIPFQSAEIIQYSKQQYHWINNGSKGRPSLSLPPVIKKMKGPGSISLPPYSLTILN